MNANKLWWIEERMKKTVEKLKAHDFDAVYVKTKDDAVKEIHKYVTSETKVGVGGSITIRELGILEPLKERGNIVYDHWAAGDSRGEQSREIRKSQLTSDLFLSSSNAVTMEGELVNVDGIGNRVSAITFGPKKVIIVAGYNKIVKNVDAAIKRVRNEATPPNSRRLNINTPCAKIGTCTDCDSPDRSCRVLVIHERKPMLTDMLIILVGEELGY